MDGDTLGHRAEILETLIRKSNLKQQVFDNTFAAFGQLKECLLEMASEFDDELEGKLDNAATAEVERWYDASEANSRHLEQLYFVLFTGDRLSAAQAVNPEYGWQALRRRRRPTAETVTA